MGNRYKGQDRNAEIITFYYHIFGHRLRSGIAQSEARNEACDAVSLRYGITKGRLLNIISSHKGFDNANRTAFRNNAEALINELLVANKSMEEEIERNNQLISLLKECAYDNR